MQTVMKISPQGQIRIPKKILDILKITTGDYVEIDIESGHAILKPRKLIDPSQDWYWTKEWRKTEAEIDKELEEEQCSPVFQTAEEGLRWLGQ
jgi:AbrB family looped-hinge helix DNA binding protein